MKKAKNPEVPAKARKQSLGERIIRRANDGYHTRLTKGPKDYPPFALTPMEDRIRWSTYIKTIADEIEAEDAA